MYLLDLTGRGHRRGQQGTSVDSHLRKLQALDTHTHRRRIKTPTSQEEGRGPNIFLKNPIHVNYLDRNIQFRHRHLVQLGKKCKNTMKSSKCKKGLKVREVTRVCCTDKERQRQFQTHLHPVWFWSRRNGFQIPLELPPPPGPMIVHVGRGRGRRGRAVRRPGCRLPFGDPIGSINSSWLTAWKPDDALGRWYWYG